MLQRITNTVMEYFSREDIRAEKGYVFVTDNPGLQQVYEAVLELGVTGPIVPMWLPEGYTLTEMQQYKTPMLNGLSASFSNGIYEIVYQLEQYYGEPAHQYYKDDNYYETYEWEGVIYHVAQNNNWWTVIWVKDNIECFLTLDCQEDTLWRILRSIYVMEAE